MSIEDGIQPLREFPLAASLPAGARDNLEVELRNGIYILRTYLLMKRQDPIPRSETVNVSFPKTWWQAFKDSYFPAWAKKMWPIKMETISKTVKWVEGPLNICPHARGDRLDHDRFLNGELIPDVE